MAGVVDLVHIHELLLELLDAGVFKAGHGHPSLHLAFLLLFDRMVEQRAFWCHDYPFIV